MSQIIPIYIPTYISDQNYNPARVLPRLLFYNGMVECQEWWLQSGSLTTVGASYSQTKFPYFDNYNVVSGSFPTTDSDSLLFFNEQAVYGETPTESLYSKYWQNYVKLLYNPRTRLINASAIIPLADYFKMELNDVVQWRGNYYHLRYINDYSLTDGTCQIQLLGPLLSGTLDNLRTQPCSFTFSSIDDSAMELEIFTTASSYSVTLPFTSVTTDTKTLLTASWGDGTTSIISGSNSVNASHTYSASGTYKIGLTGSFDGFDTTSTNTNDFRLVLTKINKWGSNGVRTLKLQGCGALNTIANGDLGLYKLDSVNRFIFGTISSPANPPFTASKVTTLPSDLFKFSPSLRVATDFAAYNKNITSAPENLFVYNNNLTQMDGLFFASTIATLPNVLFASGANNAFDMDNIFQSTPNLTGIPATLFDNVISGSINGGVNFQHAFSQSATNNVLVGNAPTLWLATGSYLGTPFAWTFGTDGPFEGCTGLTNFASIPSSWKV